MKKGKFILVTLLILAGCGSASVKADQKLLCNLTSDSEASYFASTIEVEYNKKTNQAIQNKTNYKYTGLDKTETNNAILKTLTLKHASLSQVEGVSVDLSATDTEFDYRELWNYDDVETKDAMEADDGQIAFTDGEIFSAKKIKKHYEKEGYSCYSEELK